MKVQQNEARRKRYGCRNHHAHESVAKRKEEHDDGEAEQRQDIEADQDLRNRIEASAINAAKDRDVRLEGKRRKGDDQQPVTVNAGGDIPMSAIWINGQPKPFNLEGAFLLPCTPESFQDFIIESQAAE